ncbi:class I SAM-dependent methyltransferase [candidate division WWE3 bacterium]|uniref:Class I SAM-dependent methyltransferase n=1 Tax=candidate division WWE3 bacterium TaxID=2053526 RepID=A0A955RXH0_UNCKA|nr:class I SAM-dependent methyltransferase [candidate division WWE3 bacterium]
MQQSWVQSYANTKHKKMLFPTAPSGVGMKLINFLEDHNYSFSQSLLDIGCGNGRNSIALAQKGFHITGIDGISAAIEDAQVWADRQNLDCVFDVVDISKHWPLQDNSFMYAIDINTFSSLSKEESMNYSRELVRVLQPGGLFFIYTYTIDDQYYSQFIKDTSVDGSISIYCPDDGVSRLLYSPDALLDVFKDSFTVELKDSVIRYSKMFDVYYKRNFVVYILKKQP